MACVAAAGRGEGGGRRRTRGWTSGVRACERAPRWGGARNTSRAARRATEHAHERRPPGAVCCLCLHARLTAGILDDLRGEEERALLIGAQ
eukprot:3205585-Prymnesium_polylepis.1